MPSATETTTDLPAQAAGLLVGFNRHGLPGLVIGVLFIFIGVIGYYGIRALVNNTVAMVEMTSTLRELKEEIKECREGK